MRVPKSRGDREQADVRLFARQIGRSSKKRNGFDPNDRDYNRQVEEWVRRLSPEEFDELLNGPYDEDS